MLVSAPEPRDQGKKHQPENEQAVCSLEGRREGIQGPQDTARKKWLVILIILEAREHVEKYGTEGHGRGGAQVATTTTPGSSSVHSYRTCGQKADR